MEEDRVRVLRWSVALPNYGEDDRRGSPLLLPVLPRSVGILMPFKKERYPVNWPEIRARILERDGNCCKTCRAPNGAWISRDKNFQWGVEKGAYMVRGGVLEGVSTSDDFWVEFGVYRGTPVPGFARGNFFGCSC